ncbi:hypothetical protein BH09ACT2_BH09ACT2_10770 [soil metagenome]
MALATGALVLVIALTGCVGTGAPVQTPTASAYSAAVASRLQSAVLAVSSASAAGDPSAAIARLDELAAILADARARGEVTTARFESITASLALVRADLEAAVAALTDQKPGKTEKPGKGNSGKNH